MGASVAQAALVVGAAAMTAVVTDQLGKRTAEHWLAEGEPVAGGLLRRVTNRGGLTSGSPVLVGTGALLATGIVVAGVALRRPLLVPIGAGLIAGSMASNLFDRATGDGVTDFVPSPLGVVNLADLMLGAGIAIAGLGMLVRR